MYSCNIIIKNIDGNINILILLIAINKKLRYLEFKDCLLLNINLRYIKIYMQMVSFWFATDFSSVIFDYAFGWIYFYRSKIILYLD